MQNGFTHIPCFILIEPGHQEDTIIYPEGNQHDEAEERSRPGDPGIVQQMDEDRLRYAQCCKVGNQQEIIRYSGIMIDRSSSTNMMKIPPSIRITVRV